MLYRPASPATVGCLSPQGTREGLALGTHGTTGIIADDLTGAMDTAGAFAARGIPALVCLSPALRPDLARWPVVCHNTRTRNLASAEAARAAVREATLALMALGCRRLYKKIDSTLRGHVGQEIVAVLEASGAECAFVAPAFPEAGRTQRHGTLYVGDRPLTQAYEGRDPLSPVASASVLELLSRQAGRSVGLVPLPTVEKGESAIEEEARALLGHGCTLVCLDATRRQHLDSIAGALLHGYPQGLMAGSAGLAHSVAARLAACGPAGAPPPASGPVLLVAGSVNPVTQAQVRRVAGLPGVRLVPMRGAAVLGGPGPGQAEMERLLHEAGAALASGLDVGLCWDDPQAVLAAVASARSGEAANYGTGLEQFLGTLIDRMLESVTVGGLVLAGGDTAQGVLAGARAEGIALGTEVQPGILLGTIMGGRMDGKPVATKAGGFGTEDSLAQVLQHMRDARGRA